LLGVRRNEENAHMEATPPPTPPGGYGQQPAQPGYGQSPYPQVPPGGGQLDTAATFERIGQLYTSQFAVLLGLALVVFVPIALLQGAVASSGSAGLALVTVIIALIGQALYTGAVVEAVHDMRDGRRDFSVPDLFKAAVPFIGPLILTGIVFGIVVVVGLILIIIPGLVFLTWFCLYAPAIVVERSPAFASLSRSRELVRGNGWRVFGVVVVTVVITAVIGSIIQRVVFSALDGFVGALVGNLISNLITAPIFAIAVSTLYFQLRDLQQGTSGLSAPAPPPQV
jgi:hypothetical protein